MNKKVCIVIAVVMGVVFGAALLHAAKPDCDALIKKSEKLWLERDFDGSDKVLEKAKQQCPDRAEIYWRKARNDYDRMENLDRDQKPGKEERIEYYRNMESLAEKCIELEPENGDCRLWKGISMGRRGTSQGILQALSEADQVEEAFLKAIELKPTYCARDGSANSLGDAYNALGQFYRVLPEWLCTFGIRQLVGTCGDIDKSVEYQRKAVAREPERIEYVKELGVSLVCRGQKRENPEDIKEGRKYLKKVLELPEIKHTDPIDKKHAQMILSDPSLACGYSRDAQQEQSRDAYED
ncbi:MAG: hypothetical protein R6V10_00395 [bacterium]